MIILADPSYNPSAQIDINSHTKLGPGITIARFLGSYGDQCTFNHIVDLEQRRAIARQLYLHAELIRMFNASMQFANQNLIVAESVFKPNPNEVITAGSINDLKLSGRAVVYQLVDQHGHISKDQVFDLAVMWKDFAHFDEIILDYDTYTPPTPPATDRELTASIVVIMPEIDHQYNANFAYRVKTTFNNEVLADKALQEVLA